MAPRAESRGSLRISSIEMPSCPNARELAIFLLASVCALSESFGASFPQQRAELRASTFLRSAAVSFLSMSFTSSPRSTFLYSIAVGSGVHEEIRTYFVSISRLF